MTTAADIWMPALPPASPGGIENPRIGVGGIAIESSTFSLHVSDDESFVVREGETLLSYHRFLRPGEPLRSQADWVPLLHARALPGGAVAQATYVRLRDELVARIEAAGPFDGFLLDIHGAMSVAGLLDAEADLAAAVRRALGPDTLVSASMDLHGNVSERFLGLVDLLTCYRMAPHEDEVNTRERAAHNLLRRLRSEVGRDPVRRRPLKAWVPVPVLLPGEKTSTRVEPAKSLYADVAAVEARDGVLDAAIWVGYAWADEPRCRAAVVVTGDDSEAIVRAAGELAAAFWQAREEFQFVGPTGTFREALDAALSDGAARPYVISDSGDNPTAGGAGDSSWSLTQLLRDDRLTDPRLTVIHASVFDPAAVARAREAGTGATVRLTVAGRVDTKSAPPAVIEGLVEAVVDGDPTAGTQVVIRSGAVRAIVTERRKPFHHISDFTMLGLDPLAADVVVVKIGYLEPELFELAADWTLALTPGGVDQDLQRLGHCNLTPGTWPFDPPAGDPDFEPLLMRGPDRC